MDFTPHVRAHLAQLETSREPEIVAELAQHLQDLYQEAIAGGASHRAAVTRALAALPEQPETLARDIERAGRSLPAIVTDRWRSQAHEVVPHGSRASAIADLWRDVRYSFRMLAAAPVFTAIVVLTLALGVGANTLIFTAVDAILIRTPGIADPGTLASVYNANVDGTGLYSSFSYPDYEDVHKSGLFANTAAFGSITLSLDSGETTESLAGELVSGTFFDVLGTRFALGRGFHPDEDRRGSPTHVAVVSHAFWRERLGGKPDALERRLVLNGSTYTIIGVTPPLFTGATVGRRPEVWLPMALQAEVRPPSAGLRRSLGTTDLLGQRGPRWLNVVGRFHPGADSSQAAACLQLLASRLRAEFPRTNGPRTFHFVALGEGPGVRASSRPMLRLLIAAVGLVLLIACANVTSLLVARSVTRRREIAVRTAIGAGKWRLIRQWLTESTLLALAGGAVGLLITRWTAPLLHSAGIPENVSLEVSSRVWLFTLAIAAGSGLLAGLAPVLHTLRGDTLSALRDEGGSISTGARAMRWRRGFVVFQVAVSLLLLVGAGLFLQTLRNAHRIPLGYQLDSTMVADINLDVRGYSQEAGAAVYREVLDRLNATPGVAAAGAARVTVLSGGSRIVSVSLDGQPIRQDQSNNLDVRANVVSDGYLRALGVPLLRGRDFTAADNAGAPRVAIVSQSLAARLWPGQDPLGRPVGDGTADSQVIGVVPDTVYVSAIERDPPPFYYLPLAQNYEAGVALHVRAAEGDPLALLPAVRAAVRAADSRIAVARPQRLRDVFEQSVASQRTMATLIGLFGGLALLLAAVGVYGIMEHLAAERRSEIGIRLALGATPGSIVGLILGEGLRLVAAGTAIGLFAALVATRFVANLLFGIEPFDPTTFAAGSALLAAIAMLACYMPARRAMRIDPALALKR